MTEHRGRPRDVRRIARSCILVVAVLSTAACSSGAPTPASSAVTPSAGSPTSPSLVPSPTAAPSPAPTRTARKYDIGGHSLFMECGGSGSPTLVFDTGLGGDSSNWGRYGLIPLLEPISSWCIYDRANRGRSDAAPGPRTSADVVADLHALLAAASIPPPYVLIGHSFGGYNVRLYAVTYPDEVQALVLTDTVTPEFITALEQELTPEQWASEEGGYRGGVEPKLDFIESGLEVAAAPALPQDLVLVVVAASRDHLSSEPWPADWPGERLEAIWQEQQRNLATLVPGGRLIIAEDTPHRIHIARPEFIAEILRDVIAEVRGG